MSRSVKVQPGRWGWFCAAGTIALLMPPLARAETCGPCLATGPLASLTGSAPVAGQAGEWAEYAQLGRGKVDYSSTIRLVLLPAVSASGEATGPPAWMEIWLGKTGVNALRFRLEERPSEPLFLKLGGVVYAIEPSVQSNDKPSGCCGGEKGSPQAVEDRALARGRRLEEVRTLAGRYRCQRIARGKGPERLELWLHDSIPVLRVARLRTADGRGFELVSAGRDGVSSFPPRFRYQQFPLQDLEVLQEIWFPRGRVGRGSGKSQIGPDRGL